MPIWKTPPTPRSHEVHAASVDSLKTQEPLRERLATLEEELDRLTLICRALWSLLQEQHGLAEEALFDRVAQLDLQDGELDGRLERRSYPCPQCRRMMSQRHGRCLFCGHAAPVETAFDLR